MEALEVTKGDSLPINDKMIVRRPTIHWGF